MGGWASCPILERSHASLKSQRLFQTATTETQQIFAENFQFNQKIEALGSMGSLGIFYIVGSAEKS